MGTNLIRAMLLASASAAVAVAATPVAAYAQEATYQIDIPAQSMGDALRALGKATKQNIVFNGSVVKGKRSSAVRGSMSASDALAEMLAGSGLEMSRGSGGGLVVKAGNGSAAPARAESQAADPSEVSVPSASASTVVDARTGAALKGALVEIVETGEKTSTGDLGEFRFPGKSGSFNLRISYLGYPLYEQFVDLKDGRATTGILLSDGSAAGEIVVTAYKSARAQALNQERTADNVSTVISDDLTGKFDGNTVADALKRAAGVSFQLDATTGDGFNVMVRGLAPEFNTVTLNGIRLPSGDGISRSPSLNNLLADSVSKITLNKTLLPNQESSGTGALIEIETKGPLDRPDSYISLAGDYGGVGKGFLEEYSLSGIASVRLGSAKNFGVSLSAQYRKRQVSSLRTSRFLQFGDYLPAGIESEYDVYPLLPFPYEQDASNVYQGSLSVLNYDSNIENLALGASAQWTIGGHTELRLDYQHNRSTTGEVLRSFSLFPNSGYMPLSISDLNGETRYAMVWQDYYGEPGLLARSSHLATINDRRALSNSLSFKGETNLGLWNLNYNAGYGLSKNDAEKFSSSIAGQPFNNIVFSEDDLADEVLLNRREGQIVSLFPIAGRKISLPGLTASGFDVLNSEQQYLFSFAQENKDSGKSTVLTGGGSVNREFVDSFLKYIEIGIKYERSVTSNDTSYANRRWFALNGATADQIGLGFAEDSLSRAGLDSSIRTVTRDAWESFYASLDAGNQPLITQFDTPDDPKIFEDKLKETKLAGYIQTSAELGKFQLVGGVRIEKSINDSTNIYSPLIINADGSLDLDYYYANQGVRSFEGGSTVILPRATLNFRPTESLIGRLGFYRSVALPPIFFLSGQSTFNLNLMPFFGPQRNQPGLNINLGNPDLKPTSTNNYDISFEWYFDSVGVLKVGGFYKTTKNSFMSISSVSTPGVQPGTELPSDPRFSTPNLYIVTTRPENDTELTKLWGFEVSVERQFDFLPGWLGGLGVYANFTYSRGKKSESVPFAGAPGGFLIVRNLPYVQQVPRSGTVALTYSKYGFDATLGYTAQAGWYSGFPQNGFQQGAHPYSTLDFKLQYTKRLLGTEARLFLEGSNLLKGRGTPTATSGVRSRDTGAIYNTDENYLGGRAFKVGVSASF